MAGKQKSRRAEGKNEANKLLRFMHHLDMMAQLFWGGNQLSPAGLCELMAPDPSVPVDQELGTLLTKDGTLATLLFLAGGRSALDGKDYQRLVDEVEEVLSPTLLRRGYGLQVCAWRDPDPTRVGAHIDHCLRGAANVSEQLGFGDLGKALLRSRKKTLLPLTALEGVELLAYTSKGCLVPIEQQAHVRALKTERAGEPLAPDAMPLCLGTQANLLRDRHASWVKQLVEKFNSLGLLTRAATVEETLRYWRRQVVPRTPASWRPRLPGTALPTIQPAIRDFAVGDYSRVLWPSISSQIFPDMEIVDANTFKVGDLFYAPVGMNLSPARPIAFSKLFATLCKQGTPFRICFNLTGGGYHEVRAKGLLASLTHNFNAVSKQIKLALEDLQSAMNEEVPLAAFQAAACTWAPDLGVLKRRVSELENALSLWGDAQFSSSLPGNPALGFANTLPGLKFQAPQLPAACAPVADLVGLLPLSRPAALWEKGSLLLRTEDGKLFPYEAFSGSQKAWITLVYAPMGAGKSVMLASLNLALVLRTGNEELPYIGIIDVGQSSAGLIDLLRTLLPPNRQHEVVALKLRNDEHGAINPFDLPLGCRFPLRAGEEWLVNLLTQLFLSEDVEISTLKEIVRLLLAEVFKKMSDTSAGQPNSYAPGVEKGVDRALANLGFQITENGFTWWGVVDLLFERGHTLEAELAQRHAVPLLRDLASICPSAKIAAVYGKLKTSRGEPIPAYLARRLAEVSRAYPLLTYPTRFAVSARILALDLMDVVPAEGDANRTAIMYLLARFVITRNWRDSEDDLARIPEAYRALHKKRIREMSVVPKRLVYDEFHRTGGAQMVRDQIETDAREGRKAQLEIVLASRQLSDFGTVMVNLGTSVFILGSGATDLEATAKTFKLSATNQKELSQIHKPGPKGAKMIACFSTDKGRSALPLTLSLSPQELWAFSTTAEDAVLRRELYRHLPPAQALELLARRFPGGSAKDSLEQTADEMGSGVERAKELAQEMQREWKNSQERAG